MVSRVTGFKVHFKPHLNVAQDLVAKIYLQSKGGVGDAEDIGEIWQTMAELSIKQEPN